MATISKLPSGKYRVQVRKSGVYRAKSFQRKTDAKAWASAIEASIDGGSNAGTLKAPRSLTVGDLIENDNGGYLRDVKVSRSIVGMLQALQKRRLAQVPVADLSAIHLADFVTERRSEGVTGATIASDLSALSGVLRWARRVKQIDVNDNLAKEARANLTAARISTQSRKRDRLPTDEELARLLDYFDSNDKLTIPMGDIVRFASASAMRLGEITSIRIEDISWNAKSVIIRDRKDPQKTGGHNTQTVPLVGEAYTIARRVAGARKAGRLFPFRKESVSIRFSETCKRLGIEGLTFHDLRHLAVTNLFRAGLPIELVAIVSGHKTWKQLQRYTQLGSDDVLKALGQ